MSRYVSKRRFGLLAIVALGAFAQPALAGESVLYVDIDALPGGDAAYDPFVEAPPLGEGGRSTIGTKDGQLDMANGPATAASTRRNAR